MAQRNENNQRNERYKPDINPRDQLKNICNSFIKSELNDNTEIEVRFGTKGIKPLTKIDYDNVIKKLKSLGFTNTMSSGSYSLKIEPEFLDIKTGQFKSSNIRFEINGLSAIQDYCKNNDIEKLLNSANVYNVNLMKKSPVFLNDQMVRSADFDDFNFRVSCSSEEKIKSTSKLAKEIVDNWLKNKKSFRYINRVSFTKENLPFRVDLSIVRSSTKDRGRPIKTYSTSESNVFNNPETYEIEIELLNKEARLEYKSGENMIRGVEQMTTSVLSGLQRTNYPCSYKEQNEVLREYMQIVHGDKYNPNKNIYPSDFIGPSSVTLQIKNIAPINTNVNIPNIRNDYVVTDKADGERNLLFISKSGKIYLINSSMSVMFTGAKTEVYIHSILDGELILHNKIGNFINLYAAFDIYFANGKDIRAFSFMPFDDESGDKGFSKGKDKDKMRFAILQELIVKLNATSFVNKNSDSANTPIRISNKKFYPIYNALEKKDSLSIFDACNYILRNIDDGLYEYNTDGLIFTPAKFGVGGDKQGETKFAKTWEYSFKWKPAEFNTIDFLITTKKSPSGEDVITPIFENGLNTSLVTQFTQFKTLVLRCGFDEKRHGYINPCQDVVDDKLPELGGEGNVDTRKPVQFFPTIPYDASAGLCNILLEEDDNGVLQMFTEEREVFEDNTIVEFRYDLSREGLWRWMPLRVRYDKTGEYRRGLKNYGNDYTVANSNWYSIHNPISIAMISTGQNIPEETIEDDIYYNRIGSATDTKGLRDFHNLFVKKILIQKTSKRGEILIDYACGKGGDFPKWIGANLSFVFGIDLSKDNLENRLNGACARFLNYKKEFKHMPYALFVNGNSNLNIRSGQAMLNDKAIQITKAVFGEGSKERLGHGVQRQYGKGMEGFDISSCQFAIHYMFENKRTLHNFMRNVAECTKLGGYFIGTSYDGKTVFNKLRNKLQGESIDIYENGKKIWQVIKDYDSVQLEDDETCIGYKISVFQESINQLIPEYLVNYDYLNRIMEDYGFALVLREDAKKMGLPEGSGMFIELYHLMQDELQKQPLKRNEYGQAVSMNANEKTISFLNRYFVYKKIRTVNAEKIANAFIAQLPDELSFEHVETKQSQKETQIALKESKPKVKKLQKKIILLGSSDSATE